MKCEQEKCEETESLTACFYTDNESDTPNHYFCTKHAPEHGFCFGCGLFWGGVESFDFAYALGGIQGLCEPCSEALRDELGEDDEDDDEYW